MDAKNLSLVLCAPVVVVIAVLVGGCTMPGMGPTLHDPENEPAPAQPERAIVQSQPEPPAPADESDQVGQRVRSYIEQVDTIAQRARREGMLVSQAADTEVRPPQPAGISGAARQDIQTSGHAPSASPVRPESTEPSAERESTREPEAAPAITASAAPATPASAPQLAAVTARGQPPTPAADSAAPPEGPSPNAPLIARHAPISIGQFLQQWPGETDESSFRQQLDLRILRVIAGDYEAARAPFSVVSAEQQAMGSRLIDSLIAIRQAHDGDPTEALADVLANIDGLRDTLRPLTELRIPTVVLCREVRGFGDYVPIEPPNFSAGLAAEFVVYCEVQNFISRPEEDNLYHARFEMRTTILNRAGDNVLEIRDDDVVDSCRNRRNDCFIPRLVHLPATLSPGDYVVKATVIDKVGEKVAESRASFRVVAGK